MSARYYQNNRAKVMSRKLLRRYGITLEQKTELLRQQGDCCAVCKTTEPGRKGWVVDHDHKTGRVRGIVCVGCNTLIGRLGDTTPAVIEKTSAILEYLK